MPNQLPLPKTLTLGLVLCILLAPTWQISCDKDIACMACSITTTDKCEACFNWSVGKTGPRVLNLTKNDCETRMNDSILPKNLSVRDCYWYSGLTGNTDLYKQLTTCDICRREVLYWVELTKDPVCVDDLTSGCKAISNCMTTVCHNPVSGFTTSGCRMCVKGFQGSTFDAVNKTGAANCNVGTPIVNCEFSRLTASGQQCYGCKTGFSVASNLGSCVSYTTISNCRLMNAGNKTCHYCWHSYYWDGGFCI
jgi:hypothetical protein